MTSIGGANNRKRGRPFADTTSINVRVPASQLTDLDAWINRQPEPRPSRPEAIRRLLEEQLEFSNGRANMARHMPNQVPDREAIRAPKPATPPPSVEPAKPTIPVEAAEVLPRKPPSRRGKADTGQARGKAH